LLEALFDDAIATAWRARGPRGEVVLRLFETDKLDETERSQVAAAAERAVDIEHPTIVPLREVILEGELLAIVSDPVDGLPLRAILQAQREGTLTVGLSAALRITLDMLNATDVLHRHAGELASAGFAFGGLGPDAFVVCRDGRTRMIELGVASILRQARQLRQDPERLGYDAGEVFQVGVAVGPPADVFSLAAMCWELLAAERLFTGTAFQMVQKLRSGSIPHLTRSAGEDGAPIPPEVTEAVERALSADLGRRFQSVSQMEGPLLFALAETAGRADVAQMVEHAVPVWQKQLRARAARFERAERRWAAQPGATPKRAPVQASAAEVALDLQAPPSIDDDDELHASSDRRGLVLGVLAVAAIAACMIALWQYAQRENDERTVVETLPGTTPLSSGSAEPLGAASTVAPAASSAVAAQPVPRKRPAAPRPAPAPSTTETAPVPSSPAPAPPPSEAPPTATAADP
jgi:hypothetical protein